MLAASYWSLLAPAIEMAEVSGYYGKDGKFAFIPVSVGFVFGAVFVYGADKLMPLLVSLDNLFSINIFVFHKKVHFCITYVPNYIFFIFIYNKLDY